MAGNKSSVSKKSSYKEIGEYWDSRDLTEGTHELRDVGFDIDLESDVHYYALEDSLSSKVRSIARKRGVSAETLVNLWLQEKANEEFAKN